MWPLTISSGAALERRQRLAVVLRERDLVSNSWIPVRTGGWCIASTVGAPAPRSSSAAIQSIRSGPSPPPSAPDVGVADDHRHRPAVRRVLEELAGGGDAGVVRERGAQVLAPVVVARSGWTGIASGSRSSRTRSYSSGLPSSVMSPVRRTATGAGSSAPTAATAAASASAVGVVGV